MNGHTLLTQFKSWTAFRAVILLALVVVVLLAVQPTALGSYGIALSRIVDVWLVAIALVPVLVLGEIDLSVGSTMAVTAAVTAQVSGNLAVSIPLALITGAVVGLINGLLVVKVGINSFITTLGMLITLQGLALAITDGAPVPLQDATRALEFSVPLIGQITPDIVIAVAATAALWFFMTKMRTGRELYIIGGNAEAAASGGISIDTRKILAFTICSGVAGLAGVVDTLNLVAASPTLGSTVMLLAIAAAVVGGASLSGGRASVIGAVIGAIALGGISIGLQMSGLDSSVESIAIGAILFAAIVLTKEGVRALRLPSLLGPLTGASSDHTAVAAGKAQ
ncbi:ABC ribose transporter, permease component (plasmid) [Rhodococcus jostii RHA1]|uniref:Autoinducer 2 import system permease protein LsrD n=2 Tax=Rhodococcus TaxID=1827 RepID=Q0RYT7_RHOJR|nr:MULTISPECIES: ABC transporter permease [Rhodococcus]ABG99549.1 ABC ribose transporter, permease component [Rhodococcus jostii RHA1]PQP13930.1 ABC transporter permease [Rhodococcus opacus]